MLDPSFLVSTLMGCVAGYAAVKVEIKFLWRANRERKEEIQAINVELKELKKAA